MNRYTLTRSLSSPLSCDIKSLYIIGFVAHAVKVFIIVSIVKDIAQKVIRQSNENIWRRVLSLDPRDVSQYTVNSPDLENRGSWSFINHSPFVVSSLR